MPAARQHGQDAARDFEPLLQRLIPVGVDAERHGFAHVARLGELGLEKFDGIVFIEKLGFEIQARG
jgi:hypothetical protein